MSWRILVLAAIFAGGVVAVGQAAPVPASPSGELKFRMSFFTIEPSATAWSEPVKIKLDEPKP